MSSAPEGAPQWHERVKVPVAARHADIHGIRSTPRQQNQEIENANHHFGNPGHFAPHQRSAAGREIDRDDGCASLGDHAPERFIHSGLTTHRWGEITDHAHGSEPLLP